jgi:hypothetical protein
MRRPYTLKVTITASVIAAIIGTVLLVSACSPKSTGAAQEAVAEYPTGSLLAIHTEGQLDGQADYAKKFCFSCHVRADIDAATANWGGVEKVNPHAAHTEAGECTDCHAVDEPPTLTCNECHDWMLPESWQNPVIDQ